MKYRLRILSLFILIAIVGPPGPVRADTLFAGGEDIDFIAPAAGIVTTTSTAYHYSKYARAAIGPSGTTDPMKTPFFTATSLFWLHFTHRNNITSSAGYSFISLADSNGVERLRVVIDGGGDTSLIEIYKVDSTGTTTLLVTSTDLISTDTLEDFDLYVDYSATGEVAFYYNGRAIAQYSGDVTTDGETALAQAWFHKISSWVSYYSEIFVSTENTRNKHLVTLAPQANGNTMNWTGAVTGIDETSVDDSDLISSSASGEIAQFTIPALPSGSYSVESVVQMLG